MLSGFLSPRHGASLGSGWRRWPLDMEGSCEYSRGQPTRIGPPAWGLGEGLATPYRKKNLSQNVTQDLRIGGLL